MAGYLSLHPSEPIKHGFVKQLDNGKWTSWQAYNQPAKTSLLGRGHYLNFFDGMDHVKAMMEIKKDCLWLKNWNRDKLDET